MKTKNSGQSGQLVTTALLIGLVVLTIGLGVASRAVTDIKLSRQEEESARAFNVAEAGIEELLKKQTLTPDFSETKGVPSGGITIQREVTVEEMTAEIALEKNQVLEIDVRGYTGNIDVSSDPSASMAVMIYYQDGSDYSVKRDLTSGSASITVEDNDKVVRVKVYSETKLTVTGGEDLPPRAFKITSRAQAPVGETRQVEVERTAPGLPSIFDYVLFSGNKLIE